MGSEDNKDVLAVRTSPKTGLPSIETVPDRAALLVEYETDALAEEA